MRKYIVNILFFFVVIIVVDFGFGKACAYLNAHAKGGETKQMYDLCLKNQYDVLILGSSRAHHHYVPQIIEDSLNLTCYNAGYDGNGVVMMYGIYQMIVNRYKPKLIIYDIEPTFDIYEYGADNNNSRYLSALRPYFRQSGITDIFKDVSIEDYYKSFSSLCQYNSFTVPFVIDNIKNRSMNVKGYSPMYGQMMKEPVIVGKKDSSVVDSIKIKYMKRLIQDASEKGISVIMVASPMYGSVRSKSLQPIKELCTEYKIPFVDYYANYVFMKHKEWFNEPMHLNNEGAHAFTREIVDIIKELFDRNLIIIN